jgi:flagellar biosynthetic protein FliR
VSDGDVDLQLDTNWLLIFMLVATRLSGLFVYSPVLGLNQAPMQVRVLMVLSLALIFTLALPTTPSMISTVPQLVTAALREFLIGALIGLGVHTVFGAMSLAGQLLDYQIGFNAAALFDRNTQAQNPLLSVFFGMLGGVVFLTLDGHHLLLRAVAQTMTVFPVGAGGFSVSPTALARTLGLVFLFGLALASPVAIGVFLLDMGTAFISRTMPQLNIYFVALPVKVMWGLFLLTVTLGHAGPLMQRLFTEALSAALGH